ncbi:S1C family serine protease [Myceligenerans crystallogenes]|uniref:PDZ domain-containing protein n=1 Tax=Myceligenerans crystallogenes TaxID=316335 RepID=A0ABN2N5J0_9MICO
MTDDDNLFAPPTAPGPVPPRLPEQGTAVPGGPPSAPPRPGATAQQAGPPEQPAAQHVDTVRLPPPSAVPPPLVAPPSAQQQPAPPHPSRHPQAAPPAGGVLPTAAIFGSQPAPAPLPALPQAAPVKERRRGLGPGAVVLVAVLALVAGLVGGIGGAALLNANDDDGAGLRADAALPESGGQQVERPAGSVAAIAAKALPSVVSIEVRASEGAATGSGMVLKENGYILTNNHVIAPAAAGASSAPIFVTFADGHEQEAEIVGATPDYDLAVLKVRENGLTPLVLGDSDEVVVGDDVLAAGAPLGLDSTVTTGIVSALHRPVQAGEQSSAAFIDAIQTDAAINPGNSGGPLLNSNGEVIGINSAIAQAPGSLAATGNIGLGFAIPSNQARRTAEQLIETGRATFPVIGVLLDPSYQGEGVKVASETQQGQPPVTPGGPAESAGIRPGDVILAINGRPVSQSDELVVAIRAMAPGDAVTLKVRTGGQGEGRDVRVVLDEKASDG